MPFDLITGIAADPVRNLIRSLATSGTAALVATAASGLVVTLYDLIPLVFDQSYLVTPPLRTYYRARLELLRSADAVLAISAAAAEDAVRLLGVEPDRLFNVSAGCSERFAQDGVSPPRTFGVVRSV